MSSDAAGASASAEGRWAIGIIAEAGQRAGLDAALEYPIVGGRIDVAWLWKGPNWFPAVLPIVGFEVESSWRTRKHIKGDFLNLAELQAGLGVIVLLGDGDKVESTRRFARDLVNRHACRMEVWSADEVKALQQPTSAAVASLLGDSPIELDSQSGEAVVHSGKYRRLAEWLARESNPRVSLRFREIEEILGFPLPPSSRKYVPHWHGYDGSAVARAIRDAGWKAKNVNLTAETVTLERDV